METEKENKDETVRIFGIGLLVGVVAGLQLLIMAAVVIVRGVYLYRRYRRKVVVD